MVAIGIGGCPLHGILPVPGQPLAHLPMLLIKLIMLLLLERGLHKQYLLNHAYIIVLDSAHFVVARAEVTRSGAG